MEWNYAEYTQVFKRVSQKSHSFRCGMNGKKRYSQGQKKQEELNKANTRG